MKLRGMPLVSPLLATANFAVRPAWPPCVGLPAGLPMASTVGLPVRLMTLHSRRQYFLDNPVHASRCSLAMMTNPDSRRKKFRKFQAIMNKGKSVNDNRSLVHCARKTPLSPQFQCCVRAAKLVSQLAKFIPLKRPPPLAARSPSLRPNIEIGGCRGAGLAYLSLRLRSIV